MNELDPESYRALVEHAPTMIWRSGPDGRRDYFNPAWLAFTGRALHDELEDGWTAGVHPDDLGRSLEAIERREPFELELRLRRRDGVHRWVIDRGVPCVDAEGQFTGFVGSCVESHGDHAAELFEMSLDNLCVAGFDGYLKRVNPSWTRTLGWTAEELVARPSIEFVHPDDREGVLAARQDLTRGVPLRALVNRYRSKDGTYRWLEWRSVSHVDRGVVYAAARDVTEQREAQLALSELTENLTTILNSIADGVIATDADGRVARMNPVAERLTGWSAAEAVGQPLERILRLGRGTILVSRDGTELPIASSRAPMRSADGTQRGAVVVFRDMTAEKKAEEVEEHLRRQLILADRMASVGTLAAGAAHEINNPLAAVMINLEMLKGEISPFIGGAGPAPFEEWAQLLDEARNASERIRKIVRGLMTYSRAEEERPAILDVRAVLELSVAMVENEIRHRARLVRTYGTIPLVKADHARLGQVFIDLLVNAAQAIPDGASEANEIRIVTSTDAEGRAVIEVSDTGPGIPEDVMRRVFDPFFTTKPIGLGTGLGLSVCHNIVNRMGGEITARNRKEGGASFRVVLPAAPGHVGETIGSSGAGVAGAMRRASVLVIDDDRAVGIALGRVLRDHDVTVVTSGKAALDLLVAGRPFDVVLSDLMMPEMSGMDLYDELARSRPQVAERMVFITGGAFTPAARRFLDRVPNERIEKPFDASVIERLVEKLAT